MPTNAGRAKKAASSPKKRGVQNKVLSLEKKAAVRPLSGIDPEELVFALDIGTRSVVGVVGVQEGNRFRILTTEILEHKNRAMMDGQIHDIDQVAAIVREVKDKIEIRLGMPLKRVAIAAAGRVLKTSQVRVEKELDTAREIDPEMVSSLEIEGIQRAQLVLDEDASREEKVQFYCVGYSVINYYLNGFVISKLAGHKGKTAGADILATFLPHVVVDSLYTVMSRVGLEVSSLTLEPIAAINVTIPPDLRLLNLALVDIGAGTSDIALTRDGSVVAYAMAPVAGDEITERISQHYLVDFQTAERIKIALSYSRESIHFSDILKMKHTVSSAEVLEVIRPTIELLAETISQKILEFNSKAPNAVFLIGGGSQIPGLSEMIAGRLKLVPERVVVRGRDVIQNVKFNDKKLSGPESITPYGIAITAQMQSGKDFLTVTVNGQKVRLFNSKKLTVADALILLGFNPGQLIGRTGRSLAFILNGEKKVLRGEYGKAAEIYVNKALAGIDTMIKIGDSIDVVPAQDGKDAAAEISDIVGSLQSFRVTLNGSTVDAGIQVTVNGHGVTGDYSIQDGDAIQTDEMRTLGQLLDAAGIAPGEFEILVNGLEKSADYILRDGDQVEYKVRKVAKSDQQEIPAQALANEPLEIPTGPVPEPPQNSQGMILTVNGKEIATQEGKTQLIFVDVFNYIDFDLTRPQGNIVLRLNGRPAAFTDIVRAGDQIEIYWQK